MTGTIPNRILIIRPDGYGDIVLFEPALRTLRNTWRRTEITVLIQKRYADIAPLVGPKIRWLTMDCDPYREGVASNPSAVKTLERQVKELAPDCVVAACYNKTWLEAVIATFAPAARQVSLGTYQLDAISCILLQKTVLVDWSKIYREAVPVEPDSLELNKNLQLVRFLTGRDLQQLHPKLTVPEEARQVAKKFLVTVDLKPDGFVVCCPAGVAKVAIKAWPAEKYGAVIARLEKNDGQRTLLVGHESESRILTMAQSAARSHGADPAVWTGKNCQIAVLTALVEQSRFYLGNDTGALHLAAALGKPVVGIFGGGTWPRFKPAAQRAVSVVQPLPCFGCDWECCFGDAPCLTTIPVGSVENAIDRVLAATRNMQEDIVAEGCITPVEHELIAKVAAVVKNARHIHIRRAGGSTEPLTRPALENLIEQLQFSEADRAARLQMIQQQGQRAIELEAEVHRWLEETKKYSAQAQQSESLRAELNGQVSHLIEENNQATARMNGLQTELDQERIKSEASAKEKLDLHGRLEKTRQDLIAVEADRARLSVKLEQERIKSEALAKEKVDLLGRLEKTLQNLIAAEADRTRLSADLASSADHLARLQVELERQKNTNQSLTGELHAAKEESRTLAARLDAKSHALDGTVKSLEAARARIRELQERLSTIEEHALVRVLKAFRLRPW
jgi:ADP-heptose:LPS heptosyltransferase